jgi:hypothetical protein
MYSLYIQKNCFTRQILQVQDSKNMQKLNDSRAVSFIFAVTYEVISEALVPAPGAVPAGKRITIPIHLAPCAAIALCAIIGTIHWSARLA